MPDKNSSPDSQVKYPSLPELTLRGMLLGILITAIFTASNVYLGLKVGLTFSSSIPAAVISMAVLRFFKDSNVLEQHGSDTGLCSRYSFCYHFYPSRPAHAGLLAGIPVLGNTAALCLWRFYGCLIYHSTPPCHGRKQRPPLSGRPCSCRNSQSRQPDAQGQG